MIPPCVDVIFDSALSRLRNLVSVTTVLGPQTIVCVAVLLSNLKSLSVQPLFDSAFSASARAMAGDPLKGAQSANFMQMLVVLVCPEEEVTVFSHMPARTLSCACRVVAVASERHTATGIAVVLSRIICVSLFLIGLRAFRITSGKGTPSGWRARLRAHLGQAAKPISRSGTVLLGTLFRWQG